ncbi:MAG: carboxypeptidase regulatory-like domain-containing protein [Candidatus Sulfotelmatobacter sp.]
MRFERLPIVLALLLTLLFTLSLATAPMFGQSLTTGNITGTVLDPSHAVVPGAPVDLKGLDTGSTASTTTNANGGYSFSLLKPGHYQITVKQAGFAEQSQTVQVEVGQTSNVEIDLTVAKGTETIEVSGTAPLINTEPSNNTAFTQEEVAQLPSAGGDITNIADTAPGVVVNGTMGYGNFTANGMPATSNLFTVNGENDMDPYFNINNSGASNLTLGQNEIGEATVITNPYGGQYGQLAGAQVTYVTKSGTNTFHGNAAYWWNGRLLNANDWMNIQGEQAAGTKNIPGFSNANQWATSIGGPIIKNKTFFFVDYEGMRFVLPNQFLVTSPTPQFAAAVGAQVAASNPAESATMNKLLGLWTSAPGYAGATVNPLTAGDSCATLAFTVPTPGFTPGTTACSQSYTATPTALAWEYILSFRVDQKLGNNDNIFGRYKLDHGLQPTQLDPINSQFDANSLQPSWDSQVSETHVFGPTMTNSFTATLSHYVAQFTSPNAASLFNYEEAFSEDSGIYNFFSPNRGAASFPQGRNITQYQFIDDFSWTHGNHTFKFGENFRRYDVSDHNFFITSPIVYWGYLTNNLQSFADGVAYQYRKNDNLSTNVPVALWGMGLYGQDEWKATRNLKLTLALRVERNSNPVCQTNCFANLTGPFVDTASFKAGYTGSKDVPYSSDINSGLHQAYPGVDSLIWSPRLGFSWDPRSNGKTVISGGFGQFYDNPAAQLVDNLLGNPPVAVSLRIRSADNVSGVLPFDPNGAPLTWQQSASAFTIKDSFNQIGNALPTGVHFNAPSVGGIVGTIHAPEWQEWNLSVQQELNRSTVLIVNYVGNHGSRMMYSNAWPNAYDGTGGFYSGTVPLRSATAANYGTVTQYQSGAVSNYSGLTFSLRKQFTKWVSAHLNYTWSHNIDESSNGGLAEYGFEGNNTILGQISPVSLRQDNYGNSDYDIRHLVNGDFVFNPEFHRTGGLKWLTEGWQFSGKAFWRTGLPYTLTDGNLAGTVVDGGDAVTGAIPAIVTGNAQPSGCGGGNASYNGLGKPGCLDPNAILDVNLPSVSAITYSTQRRNQYRGPHYFDMDLNLFKNFKIGERFNFAIGAQAFNAFNHPNFALPNAIYNSSCTSAGVCTPDPTYGTITTMQGVPTSPYGNFLGFDSSPRVLQLSAKIVF